MGAATERPPEVLLEDGLRKRRDADKLGSNITPSSRVTPLTQVWKPSQRVQNITIWILLAVTIFFSIAVVVEELQARWYRSPALNMLNSHFYGAETVDRVLHSQNHVEAESPSTVELSWVLTKGVINPDGVESNAYLINGEFPGPIVEARSGDIVRLSISNHLPDSKEVLFDFFEESGRARAFWQGAKDSQKILVAAEAHQNLEFQIPKDKAGTFTYRSRDRSQAAGGLFGALIVHEQQDASNKAEWRGWNITRAVAEERVLVINEWHPFTADRTPHVSQPTIAPSIVINGIGHRNCSQIEANLKVSCVAKADRRRPYMQFSAGRLYRLRLVNAGTVSGMTISIPGTIMSVIELDGGTKVQPKSATSIGVLRPGQTVDVMIEWQAGGDDEFIVTLEDEVGDGAFTQAFPIRVSGFLNSNAKPPAHKYRDFLRLKPLP